MEKAHQTADELHKVYERFGNEYDREKAYGEADHLEALKDNQIGRPGGMDTKK